MARRACPIVVREEERSEWERQVRARTSAQQVAHRAESVLRAAEGATNTASAAALGVRSHTVGHWRALCGGGAGGAAGSPALPATPALWPPRAGGHRGAGLPGSRRGGRGGPNALVGGRSGPVQQGASCGEPRRAQYEDAGAHPPGARPASGPSVTPGWRNVTPMSYPKR